MTSLIALTALFSLSVGARALAAAELPSCTQPLTGAHPEITQKLRQILPAGAFSIPASLAAQLSQDLQISPDQLMIELVPAVMTRAVAPISNYTVGIVGRVRATGDLIFGVNIEFPQTSLDQTIHAEQFVIAYAWHLGVDGLSEIAMTGSGPCGYCGQSIKELDGEQALTLLIPAKERYGMKSRWTLDEQMPDAFGPRELGQSRGLLGTESFKLGLAAPRTLDRAGEAALQAATRSYAPYSRQPAGAALVMDDGTVFAGGYLENAAFNPSLGAVRVAMVAAVAAGKSSQAIRQVILVQVPGKSVNHEWQTRGLIQAIAPRASVSVIDARILP